MQNEIIVFIPTEVSIYYLARFPSLKQRAGTSWRGACPIHRGRNENFVVDPPSGRWYCHSACSRGGDILELEAALTGGDFRTRKAEVFKLVGRTEPQQRPYRPPNTTETTFRKLASSWREIDRYSYLNRDGTLLFEVVRYLKPDGSRSFVQIRPLGVEMAGTTLQKRDGIAAGGSVVGLEAGIYRNDPRSTRASGKPSWKRAADQTVIDGSELFFRECPRVPYRLPKLLTAETVYLPEGEKDVHTLEDWGLVASCNPGGAGGTRWYAKWGDYFSGRHIVILPDNDGAGRKHAIGVAAFLIGVTASVRILDLPDLPEKADVTDWRNSGGTCDRLRELAEAAAPLDTEALAALGTTGWGAS